MVGKICTVCRKYSYGENTEKRSFFTYPGDPIRRHQWLVAVGRLDLINKLDNQKTRGNYRICEVHFEKQYVNKSPVRDGRKFLSQNAFPTLYLDNPRKLARNKFMALPISYAKGAWKEQVVKEEKNCETPRYNLRPIKRESKNIMEEETDEDSQSSSPPPPVSLDLSVLCESVIKVSQSTQTFTKSPVNNPKINEGPISGYKGPCSNEVNTNGIFSKLLSPSLCKLVKWNLTSTNGKQNLNLTLFALNLYYSSNLYNVLKDILKLPTKQKLKYSLLPKTTRLTKHSLHALRCKINNMSTKERVCSISVGCSVLKPSLYYDIKCDRIIGLTDINGTQNILLAKYAIVLIAQGIMENWRQPIAYAFISEYDYSPEISEWIDESLCSLIDIGLDIRAFVSDPRSEFLYASDSRFVTPNKTYFTINGTDIFHTYDTTQLYKIVKNNIESCDFYYGSQSTCNNIEILCKIKNLCSLLNSRFRSSNSQYKIPFTNDQNQVNFLNEMTELFQNLKVLRRVDRLDVTENMKFIQGFMITINSVLRLFEELQFLGAKYLLTGRLNQNCVNRFFIPIRKCDSKDECTPKQFNKIFVRSFVFNILKKPLCGNKVENTLDAEEFCQQLLDEEIRETDNCVNMPVLVNTVDYRENFPENDSFAYVCRYCYLKCTQIHSCVDFRTYTKTIEIKREKHDENSCSIDLDLDVREITPPHEFTNFLLHLESKFIEYFDSNGEIYSIGQQILQEFEQYSFGMPCPCFPLDYLKAIFIRVRIFYMIKKNNKLVHRKKGIKTMKIFNL